jgi:hypothetical protein
MILQVVPFTMKLENKMITIESIMREHIIIKVFLVTTSSLKYWLIPLVAKCRLSWQQSTSFIGNRTLPKTAVKRILSIIDNPRSLKYNCYFRF